MVKYERKVMGWETDVEEYERKVMGWETDVVRFERKVMGWETDVVRFERKVMGWERDGEGCSKRLDLAFGYQGNRPSVHDPHQ